MSSFREQTFTENYGSIENRIMPSTSNRVFLLSRRWPHHADHSGYDRLGDYFGQVLTTKPTLSSLLPDKIYRRVIRYRPGYDRTGIALEALGARHMASHRDCLYHVLYGENCYNYLGYLNGWRGHRVIASFHHPPVKFAEWIQRPERLKRLTAAIIVGRNQLPSFEDILPRKQIFFVPHPVDTSFYTPPSNFWGREDNLCLFVGAHLRDFETLRSVIENAYVLAPWLRFIVVVHPLHLDRLNGVIGNHTVFSNISEAKLLGHYRKSTVLIQPLVDTTANNVMLEAMSCGLPMVVSDVGAARDYVTEDNADFVPPLNPEAMLDAIVHLVNSPEKRRRMSIFARKRAYEFDWRVIAHKMAEVYSQVFNFDCTQN